MQGLGCLIIDMQDRLLPAISDSDLLIKRSVFVAETCSILDIPLFVSEQVPEKLGPTTEQLSAIFKEDTVVFSKNSFSAWDSDVLLSEIRAKNIHHLLVCGIETSVCVYQTVIQAIDDDFSITLLSDAIGMRRKEDEAPVISTLQQRGVLHLPSETVFYSILRNTNHPRFRDFTKLVKESG